MTNKIRNYQDAIAPMKLIEGEMHTIIQKHPGILTQDLFQEDIIIVLNALHQMDEFTHSSVVMQKDDLSNLLLDLKNALFRLSDATTSSKCLLESYLARSLNITVRKLSSIIANDQNIISCFTVKEFKRYLELRQKTEEVIEQLVIDKFEQGSLTEVQNKIILDFNYELKFYLRDSFNCNQTQLKLFYYKGFRYILSIRIDILKNMIRDIRNLHHFDDHPTLFTEAHEHQLDSLQPDTIVIKLVSING